MTVIAYKYTLLKYEFYFNIRDIRLPHSIVIIFRKRHVMDDFVLPGMGRGKATCKDLFACQDLVVVMRMTTGSQSLIVRAHCIVKGRGRSGAGGRKGATYKKHYD